MDPRPTWGVLNRLAAAVETLSDLALVSTVYAPVFRWSENGLGAKTLFGGRGDSCVSACLASDLLFRTLFSLLCKVLWGALNRYILINKPKDIANRCFPVRGAV